MKILRLLAILCAAALTACGHHDEPKPNPGSESEVSRTVLVYMVATNTLGNGSINNTRYDYKDLDEMLKAVKGGALNGGRLWVYHCEKSNAPVMKEVTPEGIVELKTYGDDSPLAVSTMRGVLDDMRSLAPADGYGLIMWSHSSGWMDPGKDPKAGRAYSVGSNVPVHQSWGIHQGGGIDHEMSIPSLGEALNGQNLMFIYFDSCFMGNIESIYQIRGAADYVIASATEVPVGGMTYDTNVANFFKKDIDYKAIAKNTFDYYNGQSGLWRSISMSVYDMSKVRQFASAAAGVFEANPSASVDISGISSYSGADLYPNRFFDLKQYINSLSADKNAVNTFNQVFHEFVVYTDHTPYMWWDGKIDDSVVQLDGTNGLSCYVLTGENDNKGSRYKYKELEWWKDVVSKAFEK